MKKRGIFIFLFLILLISLILFSLNFVSAGENCSDSDITEAYTNGKNIYEQGSVEGRFENSTDWFTAADYCTGDREEGYKVVEYYCGGDGYVTSDEKDCDLGCKNGRCNVEENCRNKSYSICQNGDAYWVDSCDRVGEVKEACGDLWCLVSEYDAECRFIGKRVTCKENWTCESWSSCIEGNQTRACTELNSCGTENDKPLAIQNCTAPDIFIGGKKVIIEKTFNKTILKIGNVSIETYLKVIESNGKIYINSSNLTKEIKILPDYQNLNKTEIKIQAGGNEIFYLISETRRVRFVLIFPFPAEIERKVNIETGEEKYTKKPWWAFLSSGF